MLSALSPYPKIEFLENVKLCSFQQSGKITDGKVMQQVQAVTFCNNRSYVQCLKNVRKKEYREKEQGSLTPSFRTDNNGAEQKSKNCRYYHHYKEQKFLKEHLH